ncbi:MAG: hypothetical protein ACYCOR_09760 [Acidobacteriaceae bacterium]
MNRFHFRNPSPVLRHGVPTDRRQPLLPSVLVSLAVLGSPALAQGSPLNPAILSANHGGYLTYDQTRLKYQETSSTGAPIDSDTGTLKGFSAGWTWLTDGGFYARAGVRYTKGTVTYVGHTLSGTPVTGNMDTDRVGELPTLRFGHMFRTSQRSGVATYVRAGLGAFGRVIGVTASTPNGQYRESNAFIYLGLGVQGQYALTDRLVGTISAGYDLIPYSDLLVDDGAGGTCGVKLPGKGQMTGGLGLN